MFFRFVLLVLTIVAISHQVWAEEDDDFCAMLLGFGVSTVPPFFINVPKPGDANLTTPFIRTLRERGRFTVGGPKERVISIDNKLTLTDALDLMVIRTVSFEPPELNASETLTVHKDAKLLFDQATQGNEWREFDVLPMTNTPTQKEAAQSALVASLDYLHNQYEQQGEERSAHVGTYRDEDRKYAYRTTHFLFAVNNQVVAHIQAQSSMHVEKEPHNFELHFSSIPRLERNRADPSFEIGRMNIVRSENLKPETRQMMEIQGLTSEVLFYRALQKVTSWLTHDAGAVQAAYQVKSSMLRNLKNKLTPVKLHPIPVLGTAHSPKEWILHANRQELFDIEVISTARLLSDKVDRALGISPEKNDHPNKTRLRWAFWPNEFEALKKIGVVALAVDCRERRFLTRFITRSPEPYRRKLPDFDALIRTTNIDLRRDVFEIVIKSDRYLELDQEGVEKLRKVLDELLLRGPST